MRWAVVLRCIHPRSNSPRPINRAGRKQERERKRKDVYIFFSFPSNRSFFFAQPSSIEAVVRTALYLYKGFIENLVDLRGISGIFL